MARTQYGKATITDLDLRRDQRLALPALAQPVYVHTLTREGSRARNAGGSGSSVTLPCPTRASLRPAGSAGTDLSLLCFILLNEPVLLCFRYCHSAVSPLSFLCVNGKAAKARSAANPNFSVVFSTECFQKFPGQEGEFKKEAGEGEAEWLCVSWWHKGRPLQKVEGQRWPGKCAGWGGAERTGEVCCGLQGAVKGGNREHDPLV